MRIKANAIIKKKENCKGTIVTANNMFFDIASLLPDFGSLLISLILHYVSVYVFFSALSFLFSHAESFI